MQFIRNHRNLVLLCIFSFCCFLAVCISVLFGEQPIVDAWIYEKRHLFQSEWGIAFMLGVSAIFHPVVIVGFSLLIFGILLFQKRYALASILLGSVCLAALSSMGLKYLFNISRPIHLFEVEGQAFPSAHAAVAAVFSVIIVSSFYKKVHDKALDIIVAITMLGMVLAVGLSRIYLSVHWVSDVIGGFSLGIFIATSGLLLYARIHHHYNGTYPSHS